MATLEPDSLNLPQYLLEDILNRVEDARDIAKAQLLCKDFFEAGNNVRSLRIVCLNAYHESAREFSGPAALASDESSASSSQVVNDGSLRRRLSFKDQMVRILEKKRDIVQLRTEIETKLQAKSVPADERRRTDFWISDPSFLEQWLPHTTSTLQHLCIVDYGQQAIMRKSSIIKILSQRCKQMKTLDLRNMFLDTSDCEMMPLMTSLTLRFVIVTSGAFQGINGGVQEDIDGKSFKDFQTIMPKLQTLALLGVFGVKGGHLTFPDMKVLCLGLSTPAKHVSMKLPNLEKLQVKMQCLQTLTIDAPLLKHCAFKLEVAAGAKTHLVYHGDCLEEVQLNGASSFLTLSSFAEKLLPKNPNLVKSFLDVPCMVLDEDKRVLGIPCTMPLGNDGRLPTLDIPCMELLKARGYSEVLRDVPFTLPSFSNEHECGNQEMPNASSGLWKCIKQDFKTPAGLGLRIISLATPADRPLMMH